MFVIGQRILNLKDWKVRLIGQSYDLWTLRNQSPFNSDGAHWTLELARGTINTLLGIDKLSFLYALTEAPDTPWTHIQALSAS
jgi:hypothetical protein